MTAALPSGTSIRKLWPSDIAAYREHLLRLDVGSRRCRFGGAVSDEFIDNYCRLTDALRAIMDGFFADGVLRGVGELRGFGAPLRSEAEAAFSVEQAWQHLGVGSALLERTLLSARNRGIKHLHMACLADNKPMQNLARRFDAELSFEFGSVVGELTSPQPTPLTVMREAVADTAGFATAVLDAQSRLLRTADAGKGS